MLRESAAAIMEQSVGEDTRGDRCMSLVVFDEDGGQACTEFVSWIPGRPGWCRVASLDEQYRVKTIVPARIEALNLNGRGVIAHPGVGVRSERNPRGEGPKMPAKCFRVRSMWRTAMAMQLDGPRATVLACASCGGDADIHCAVCLLGWYYDCAHLSMPACNVAGLPHTSLTGHFNDGSVCRLCMYAAAGS